MDLTLISLNNIKVLANFNHSKNYLYCKDTIILHVNDGDGGDGGDGNKNRKLKNDTLSEIEYVLYFSFHQLINIPVRELIDEYSRENILNMMKDAIENVYLIYDIPLNDVKNKRISLMIDEINDIILTAQKKYRKNKCYFKMLDTLDYLCSGFTAFHDLSIDFNSHISGIIYDKKSYEINLDEIDSPSDDLESDDLPSDDLPSDDENDNKRRKLE
jgi:hypothetical protein